jgi:transcription elongation factor Elf1
MKSKLYKCQNPSCEREVSIRSTIKSGELKGLKVCNACKHNIEGVVKPRTRIAKFSSSKIASKKSERSGLPKFFEDAITELRKNPICSNCGKSINSNYMPHWNIAHILPKQKYKSVMDHPLNWIPLCSSKDTNGIGDCHSYFDSNINDIPNMNCFGIAKDKFEKFKTDVMERGKIFTIFEEN